MESIIQRLLPLYRDVLNDDKIEITPESNADSINGYDSLAHIDIISAIEREFSVSFEFTEIVALNNVGDMITLISRKAAVAA